MKKVTYEYIWRNILEPNINKISEDIIASHNIISFHRKDLQTAKVEIFEKYERKRDRIKELYHFSEVKETQRIDAHKIAACFAAVLSEFEIFSYEVGEELSDEMFLANAKLAYQVSLGIIHLDLMYHYKKMGDDKIVDKLVECPKLQTPPTNPGHDEYNLGREKTIALNDLFGDEFDVLTYSDMMFWIEFYNRQILENTITPKLFDTCNSLYDEVVTC